MNANDQAEITALARSVVYRNLPTIDYQSDPMRVHNDLGWAIAASLVYAMRPLQQRIASLEAEVKRLKEA